MFEWNSSRNCTCAEVSWVFLSEAYEPQHDKINKMSMCPAKTQISLGIHLVWSEQRLRSAWASAQSDQSSLCAHWVAKNQSFLHADSEDSDQTGRMPTLIWVFAGHTAILMVLSCCGSYVARNNETDNGFDKKKFENCHEKICFLPYANNKGTDQPAHPRSLISTFIISCWDSIIPILAIPQISRLASFYCWAGGFESDLLANPENRFSCDKGSFHWPVR